MQLIDNLSEKADEELSAPAETDLDSLMDKYDDAEKEKAKPKKVEKQTLDASGQPIVSVG